MLNIEIGELMTCCMMTPGYHLTWTNVDFFIIIVIIVISIAIVIVIVIGW